MKKLLLLSAAAIAIAGPAHAGPVAAVVGWVGSTLAAGGVAAAALRIGIGLGLNLLATALSPAIGDTPKVSVKFDVEFGDEAPLSFIAGDYVTAGKQRYVGSWGKNNRYITEVFEVSALPQPGLAGMWAGDQEANILFGQTETDGTEYNLGHPVEAFLDDNLPGKHFIWVRWVDGTQTAADPMLVDLFGDDPDYPWTADMIGTGKSYVIATWRYNESTLPSKPAYLFQPQALPMYDPRKDSAVGGSGAHSWGDRSTYEPTSNAAVIAYNIARGIYFGGEWVFGGRNLAAWRLPLAEWFAAMNACDAAVPLAAGGTEPAFRCGLQISADMRPADVLEEIGRAANMRFAEVGGMLKPIVGLPGAAAFAFSDDSILITEGQSYKPFNGLGDTFNALSATYPDPVEKWASKDAPEYVDAGATADDGGRYLPTSISYPAAPYRHQVQRLMRAQMRDYRRMRQHQFYLPPEALSLEPLVDMVSWTSARNGYLSKLFLVERVDPTPGLNVLVSMREVDPSDYDWSSGYELPVTPVHPAPVTPWVQVIAGFAVTAVTVTDSENRARAPAIRVSCAGDEVGVTHIRIQVRKFGDSAAYLDIERPFVSPYQWDILDVVSSTQYQVRARLVSRLTPKSAWTDWLSVTTDLILIGRDEIATDILDDLQGLIDWADGTGAELAALTAELEAESARVDVLVQGVRDDLASEVGALELSIASGLASANGYTDTAISTYDLTVQGQFSAMVGQIEELTAALTSGTLIQNGSFTSGATYWTLTGASVVAREGSSNALVLAAPDTHMAQVGVSATGSVAQQLIAFEVSPDDRLQIRFSAASAASSRALTVEAAWRDASGAALGTPATQALTLAPANAWQVLNVQFDPPDDAVGAVLTISKSQTGEPVLVTKVSAETVNVEIIARVAALEAAQATTAGALATLSTSVDTRFGAANAAVVAESAARADADTAIGQRLDAVEAVNATQTASITGQATAIATATDAIAQLDERLAVQFGATQLVRDPDFSRSLDFWPGSLGGTSNLVNRQRGSGSALQNDMPGARAFLLAFDEVGYRATMPFEVSTSERYDLGAYAFRGAPDSPDIRVYIQWQAESGAQVGSASVLTCDPVPQFWVYFSATGLAPPAGATRAQVVFRGIGGSDGNAAVTGITLTRQAAFEARSSAEIAEVRQAQADSDSAFTAWRSTMDSRVDNIESVNSVQATQISDRYTRAQTDSAISAAINSTTATLTNQINQRATTTALNALTARVSNTESGLTAVSDSITQVTAEVNNVSASGLLRVQSHATPSGSSARIAITATAGQGGDPALAGLFVEARSDGTSRVSVVADQFVVASSTSAAANRSVPFYVRSGTVYMDTAVIREATITKLHIGNGEIVGGYTATLSGSNTDWNTNREIARFVINLPEACRGLFVFECTVINRNDITAECSVVLQLNGATVRRSQSTITGTGNQTPVKSMARSSVALNLVAGANVVRLWGNNIHSVTYLFDAFAFQR